MRTRRALRLTVAVISTLMLIAGLTAMSFADHVTDRNQTHITVTFSDDCSSFEVTTDPEKDISHVSVDTDGNYGVNAGGNMTGSEFSTNPNSPTYSAGSAQYTPEPPNLVTVQVKAGQSNEFFECDPGGEPGCPDGLIEDSVTDECVDPCPDDTAPADGVCPTEPCPDGTVADSVTDECVEPCPDDTAPADGVCPTEPCPDGTVADSVTDECVDPCPDDTAPADGVCPVEPAVASCRAVLLQVLGIELFEANPDSEPCQADDQGPVFLLLDALGLTGSDLGGFIFFLEDGKIVATDGATGIIVIDLLYSRTRGNPSFGFAQAGIASISIITADGEQIGVEVGTSDDLTVCGVGSAGRARVAELRLAGEVIGIPGGNTVIDQLEPVLNLRLEDGEEGRNEGTDDTGSQSVDALVLEAISAAVSDSETSC